MTAPIEHLQDALEMVGDAYIDLFEVRLRNLPYTARFWNGASRIWQGNTYDALPCQLTGESQSADGEKSRPILTVINPDNLLGLFAAPGYFDLAEVIRKRVLQTHFVNNVNIFEQRVWLVGRVASVRSNSLRLELRGPTDMPVWKTPRRQYTPPDFPFVTI